YMTNLLNRRGLYTAMDNVLHTECLPLAVCVFDLDTLKKVNDTLGHSVGDSLIMAFTDILRNNTRSNDLLCRYGGDEFVVILKNIRDEEAAVQRINGICKLFGESFKRDDFTASCSAGIAFCGSDDIPTAELLDRADQALYRAKKENKGSCHVWRG
ncbi:MAG: GGDEF domain-containing protein, partial [Christensenellales bacterium]